MMLRRITLGASITALVTILPQLAFAHHPLGGMTPQTMMQGFLSGIGHPVIGLDHLGFIIAIGLLAAFHKNRFLLPLGFVVATIAGTLLAVTSFSLPFAEFMIALSVLGAGLLVARGRMVALVPAISAAGAAGLFHGYAYGATVIGAETTPIMAYLVGFAAIQFAIASAAGLFASRILLARNSDAVQVRLAGAMVAGMGLFIVAEQVEAVVFSMV